MRSAMRFAVVLLALASLTGCGDSGSNDNTFVWYQYWFLGAQPFEFSGDGAEDPQVRTAAAELLTHRAIDFDPELMIQVYPRYRESHALNQLAAVSEIRHPIAPDPPPGENPLLKGDATYNGPQMTIRFERDVAGQPLDMTIEYTFDVHAAQALVDSLEDWRTEEWYEEAEISDEFIEADVVIRGLDGDTGGGLRCRQRLFCVAEHMVAI